MVAVVLFTYLFAFLGLIAASPHTRRYNTGQLTWPPAGYSVKALSTLSNITYQFYDSLDAGTKFITIGFAVSPDRGDHYTYPVANFTLDEPGTVGITIHASATVPRSPGRYKFIVTDYRAAGVNQDLYSIMTVNQSITVTP